MSQLSGMIRYEMLMQWRRRGVLVLMLVLLVMLVGLTLLISGNGAMKSQIESALQPMNDETRVNTVLAINLTLLTVLAFAVTVPLMTSETVPIDHQYRVTDLLNSLPLTRTTYLLGKLLSVWSILGIGLAICFVISSLVTWMLIGSYDLISYLLSWLISVVPITLFTSALGTLLASTQPSRRRGIMLIAPISIYPYVVVIATMGSVWRLMALLRPEAVANVFAYPPPLDTESALSMYLFLAGNILFCWCIAWAWQRWQIGRA
jgi:ABC-type transport system involved in multi-copper enzyme maturation permease subunit